MYINNYCFTEFTIDGCYLGVKNGYTAGMKGNFGPDDSNFCYSPFDALGGYGRSSTEKSETTQKEQSGCG